MAHAESEGDGMSDLDRKKIQLSKGVFAEWNALMRAVEVTEDGYENQAIYLDAHAMHLLLRWWHQLSEKA